MNRQPTFVPVVPYVSFGRTRQTAAVVTAKIAVIACSLLIAQGCGLPRAAAPPAAELSSQIVGRVQISRDGKPLNLGTGASGEPLATISFVKEGTREAFSAAVDPTGVYSTRLPPGQYSIGMRYYTWLFGVPAVLDVPAAQDVFCVGTLKVSLFARTSAGGGLAQGIGGAIPQDNNDVSVEDETVQLAPQCKKQMIRLLNPPQ